MAIMIGTGRGAANGILIKNASALEQATRLEVVIFDKTGTLTLGKPEVVEAVASPGRSEVELLALAAGIEKYSEHPLVHAILEKAKGLEAQTAETVTNIDGMGARAIVANEGVLVGNRRLMDAERVDLAGLKREAERLQRRRAHEGDPFDLVGAIGLSRVTLRKMHQNLGWAVGYNVLAFPLAAGVLYPFTISWKLQRSRCPAARSSSR